MKNGKYVLLILVVILAMTFMGCGASEMETVVVTEDEIVSVVYTETIEDVISTIVQPEIGENDDSSVVQMEIMIAETKEEETVHEHNMVYTSKGECMHDETCELCGYTETVDCILNEEYICTVCGQIHEHDCMIEKNEDATHTYSCKYSACEYSYVEECVYLVYECTCGNKYPWEKDIKYFDDSKKGTYYAQKVLNVYRYPNTSSEVIDTLGVDEEVNCVGSVFYGSGANYECYYITEGGGCIPVKFQQTSSRWDLRMAKTTQVIARCGSNYTVYDNFDIALQSVCGYSWSIIKQTWQYNDYKSQGLTFMNSYSQNGITVATKDGVVPYNCNMNGVDYYFE